MKNTNEANQMNELHFTMLQDEERAKVARCVVHLNEEMERFEAERGEQDLRGCAEDALQAYYRNRQLALEQLKDSMEKDDDRPVNEGEQTAEFKKMYLNMMKEHLNDISDRLNRAERCDRLNRFIQGMDHMMNGEFYGESEPYSGPVTEEAENELLEELAERASILNVSMSGMRSLTKKMVREGTVRAGTEFASQESGRLKEEAIALYMLAHEGKLPSVRSGISMEECVNFVALMQDVDSLRRAETAGRIAGGVAMVLAVTLLFAAIFAIIFLLPAEILALAAAIGATGLLEWFMTVVAFAILFGGISGLLYVSDQRELPEPVAKALDKAADAANRMGSYLAIMVPAKLRGLFKGRTDNNGGDDPDNDPAKQIIEEQAAEAAAVLMENQTFA